LDLRAASAQDSSAVVATGALPRNSTTRKTSRITTDRQAATAGQYFIEFRSRYALSYGHTFAMFGRLDGRGDIAKSEVAGLHPAGNDPTPWVIGHLVPVPSETGPSDGDLEEKYVSARYRVTLSEAEYNSVVDFIRKLQRSSPAWHAIAYNCNAFVADIARFMGLRTPSSTLLYPADFINSLRDLNGGRQNLGATAPRTTAE
jgi:hypothetical protein